MEFSAAAWKIVGKTPVRRKRGRGRDHCRRRPGGAGRGLRTGRSQEAGRHRRAGGRELARGQSFWSLGGLFFVDSPEQRRMRIRDSYDLAFEDWMGTAGFDRDEDHWPRRWAEAYLGFAAGEKRAWLRERGLRFFPVVGW